MSCPPSPFVVTTDLPHPGGTPAPSLAPVFDDDAPCPPTPHVVHVNVEHGAYWSISELHNWARLVDPLPDDAEPGHCIYCADDDRSTLSVDSHDQPDVEDDPDALETYAHPSPVLMMMQRATLDANGLGTQPITPATCLEPLQLFPLTGGHVPRTGLHDVDRQSFEYYAKRPRLRLRRDRGYRYPIEAIEALQRSLLTEWPSVFPMPIPPVIIRSRDIIGPFNLDRRGDGHAYVMPTEDSLWGTLLRRGVDTDYRPMARSLTVETSWVDKGAALYYPQHVVASGFAVNVFLEFEPASNLRPLCDYLGAYVLRVLDGLTPRYSTWVDMDPRVQQTIYDRLPDRFRIYEHPSLGAPFLPCVSFHYYKWDGNMVGLADESFDRMVLTADQYVDRQVDSLMQAYVSFLEF